MYLVTILNSREFGAIINTKHFLFNSEEGAEGFRKKQVDEFTRGHKISGTDSSSNDEEGSVCDFDEEDHDWNFDEYSFEGYKCTFRVEIEEIDPR